MKLRALNPVKKINIAIVVIIATMGHANANDLDSEIKVGEALFAQKCAHCHAVDQQANSIGPSLYDIVGRHVASTKDYPYSSALRTGGFIWTEDNLTRYINDPRAAVPCQHIRIGAVTMCPGIHMKFQGFHDPNAARAVVNYLKNNGNISAAVTDSDSVPTEEKMVGTK